MNSYKFDVNKWMLLYSLNDQGAITGNFSYQFLPANTNVDTGQEFADFFDTETELAARVDELLGANYYEENRQYQWYLEFTILPLDESLVSHNYGYLPLDFVPTMDVFNKYETEIEMINAVQKLLNEYGN